MTTSSTSWTYGARWQALLVTLLLASAMVRAQDDELQYRAHVAEAASAFDDGRWAAAKLAFERAHALKPSAKTERGLGQVYFELRDYARAINHLRTALAAPPDTFSRATRSMLEHTLTRATAYVAMLHVRVRPSYAHLTIDGMPIDELAAPLPLNPGHHVVEASLEGYGDAYESLELRSGMQRELQLVLTPSPPRKKPARSDDDPRRTRPRTHIAAR
ncbi:MAG: hypothetical protein ABW321_06345 [Polyangiales bacterium]